MNNTEQSIEIGNINPKIKVKIFDRFYKEQKQIARAKYKDGYKMIIVKSPRQTGKSFLCDHCAIADALNKKNQKVLWVTPSESHNKDALLRFEEILGVKLPYDGTKSNGNVELKFANGSIINFKTAATKDSLRGKRPDSVYIDEAAFINDEAFEYGIEPYRIANKDLCIIMASTPSGKNMFWNQYQMAVQGEKGYIKFDLHYTMNPNVNMDFIEQKRRTLPPDVFQQEYEGQFLLGKSQVFGEYKHLQTINEWDAPDRGLSYFFGIDWSSGGGVDETTITIMDNFGDVAYIKKMEKINEIRQVEVLAEIINRYNCVFGYSENNGLGHTCNTILEKKRIKFKRFNTTNTSKANMVGQLILDINTDNITLPTSTLCPELDVEMNLFEVSTTKTNKLAYSHPKGGHDDFVDSLALSNLCRKEMMFGGGNKVAKVNRVSKRKGHFTNNKRSLF